MESDIVKESIEYLIKARPNCVPMNSEPAFLSCSLDNLPTEVPKEIKRVSMKRKSVALPITKCNCGQCSKCVPTPSG